MFHKGWVVSRDEVCPAGMLIFELKSGLVPIKIITLQFEPADGGLNNVALGTLVSSQLFGVLNDTILAVAVRGVLSSEHAIINTCSALSRPEIHTFPFTVRAFADVVVFIVTFVNVGVEYPFV